MVIAQGKMRVWAVTVDHRGEIRIALTVPIRAPVQAMRHAIGDVTRSPAEGQF